jgi:tRNA (guanine37-N1)-methyltransferase
MNFDVLTLFPELISYITDSSIIGRAKKSGLINVRTHDIRDFSNDKHRRVDDTPYGGGKGMLMAAPPVYDCYENVRKTIEGSCRCVYMSPQGKILTQRHAAELLDFDNLIILCGHYEGIDRRVIDEIVDEEISVGDYVLTGGELPACILIDVMTRMIDGVLAAPECFEKESIMSGELEYPQYTRPLVFHGVEVPKVLQNGNHAEIENWRKRASLELTKKNRPDLV